MQYTINGERIGSVIDVENITLVLQGEHKVLNQEGWVTPVNLGEYSVRFSNGKLIFDEDKLEKELKRAIKSIFLTFIEKQSRREK